MKMYLSEALSLLKEAQYVVDSRSLIDIKGNKDWYQHQYHKVGEVIYHLDDYEGMCRVVENLEEEPQEQVFMIRDFQQCADDAV